MILSKGDVFGDTMNVCARLVALANPEQMLTTAADGGRALARPARRAAGQLFPTRIKGKADEVAVCDVLWRYDPDDHRDQPDARGLRARRCRPSLKLIYRGNIFIVNRSRPTLQIGRDKGNDIVIVSLFASRVHARVQARDGHFVLTDLSTNGTFLLVDDNRARRSHLRREEAVLSGRGWIGLGKSAVDARRPRGALRQPAGGMTA